MYQFAIDKSFNGIIIEAQEFHCNLTSKEGGDVMKTEEGLLACCKKVPGVENIWEICWFEHGGLKSKYVSSQTTPEFKTFSQIRAHQDIPKKDVLRMAGILPERRKRKRT